MLPTIDDVHPVVQDFEPRMRKVLEAAWDDWMAMPSRGRLSPRSRASIVFDFIRAGAIDEFDGDPEVRVIEKGQTVHFLFRDRILARFKKASGSGLGSNIETQAVLEFIDPQLSLPDFLPEVHRVEVCYHLDSLATRIDLLTVAARQRHRCLWSYELECPPSADIVPIPTPVRGDTPPPEIWLRTPAQESDIDE